MSPGSAGSPETSNTPSNTPQTAIKKIQLKLKCKLSFGIKDHGWKKKTTFQGFAVCRNYAHDQVLNCRLKELLAVQEGALMSLMGKRTITVGLFYYSYSSSQAVVTLIQLQTGSTEWTQTYISSDIYT